MKGNEFLDKMELIDPAYVEAADAKPKRRKIAWVKWGAMAACFCLVVASAFLIPGIWNTPVPPISDPGTSGIPVPDPDGTIQREDEPVEYPPTTIIPGVVLDEPFDPGSLIFNDATSLLSASRRYIPGYFTEELSDEELSAIKPNRQMPDMMFSAVAGFDGEGTLLEVFLMIDAPSLDETTHVTFSNGNPSSCYQLLEEPLVSTFNSIDFTIYQWTPDNSNYTLDAQAVINGWTMQIVYTATAENLEKAKTDLATIILCLSDYEDGKPDFSAIVAESIPEYFDKKISLSEAYSDSDFGSFMVQSLPDGFSEESIRRYKDQNNDYLSGLWTKGLANLSWNISAYDEKDSTRLTSVAQTENYDLSLYPIPRAESVPEELREIVDNPIFDANELTLETVYMRAYKADEAGDVDGWRMAFSVKYGDVIVEVRTKGVEPEWVYQQLMNLLEN